MSDNIIEEWLRSLNLIHYTQAFLDNGYDDLEICKQIGQPDLDAIGVQKPSHRKEILDAVRSLRELGGTSVYFTLEEVKDDEPLVLPDDGDSDRIYTFSAGSRAKKKLDEYEEGKKALVTFPRVQLIGMIRDKLRAEEIDIGVLPYTNPDGSRGDMDILAHRYAEDFKTHFHDVLERLDDLRRKKIGLEPEDTYTNGRFINDYANSSGEPPPLPKTHPPSLSGLDGSPFHRRTSQTFANPDDTSLYYSENIYGDTNEDGEKKKGVSTLARLFGKKSKQQKRANYIYRQFEGDPHASQITMTNDQILEIMLLVKDGKMSQAQAIEQVKVHGVKKMESTENGDHSLKDLDSKSPGFLWFKPKDSPKRKPKQQSEARLQEPTDYEEPPTPDNDTARLLDSRLQPTSLIQEEHRFQRSQSTDERFPQQTPPFHIFRKSSTDSNVSAPVFGCLQDKYSTQTSGHSWARDTSAPNISDSIACGSSPRLRKERSDLGPTYAAGTYKPSQLEEDIEENQNYEDLDDDMATNGRRLSVIEKIRKLSHPRRPSESQCSTDDEIPSDKEKHISNTSTDSEKSLSKGKKGIGIFYRKKKTARTLRTNELQLNSDGSERYPTDSQKSSDDSLALRSSAESMGSTSQVSSSSFVSGGSSTEEDSVLYAGAILAKAVVITNCTPSPYERGALTLEKGDIVQIIDMDQSGMWKGIHRNKLGTFKFINVEILKEDEPTPKSRISTIKRYRPHKPRPKTLEELLRRIGLERLQGMFFLNGYSNLEDFSQIDEDTLNDLLITDPETRGKILTAAELLLDYDSQDSNDQSSGTRSDSKATPTGLSPCHSPVMIPSPELSPRTGSDSGCVDTEGLDESRETDSNSDTLKVSTESGDLLETNVAEPDNGGETPVVENCDIQPIAEISSRNSQVECEAGDGVVLRENQKDVDTQCQGQNQKLNVKQIVQSIQQRQSEMVGNGYISTSSSSLSSDGTQMSPKLRCAVETNCQSPKRGPKPTLPKRTISVLTSPRSPGVNILPVRSQSFDYTHDTGSPEMSRKNVDLAQHKCETLGRKSEGLASMKCEYRNVIHTQAVVHTLGENMPQDTATQTSDIQSPTDSIENGILDSPRSSSSNSSRSSRDMRDASTQFSRRLAQALANNEEIDSISQGVKVVKSRSQSLTRIVPSTKHSQVRRPSLTGVTGQPASPRQGRPNQGKQPLTSLEQLLCAKLEMEGIDLTQEPYTDTCGYCGIPAPLVQRYAEELRSNLNEVAQNMENIRVKDAKAAGITTVPNDNLAETALNPVHDANTDSLNDLMTSIGLPMYTDLLLQHGCKSVDVFRNLRDTDFKACGVTDSSHIRKLVSVADLLRFRYEAKLQTGKVAKASMIKDKV
ncbi:SAM and SH3 domain-containing protein 1-like isoform X2 [Lineus longissimus]|uniref:SAM and SH3 domain-containing protein 1-like isoform X2 n=1 Tax=Lineus longissimus TaxID=88925 RepID=UPI00315D7B9E